MALGIQTESSEGGNFLPIIKYDARAGRFFRRDRSQDGGGAWVTDDVDITNVLQMVMDFAAIEVGYISFTGGTPDFRLVPIGHPLPPRPADKDDKGQPLFKQGFRCKVKLAKSCGGDVREWSHTAKVVLSAVDAIHDAYTSAPEAAQGKLPIVKCTGATPIKSGQSTNYQPVLEIAGWVDRPEGLPLPAQTGHAAPAAQPQAQQPAPQAPYVPPPAQRVPEAASAGAEF